MLKRLRYFFYKINSAVKNERNVYAANDGETVKL